MAIEVRNEGILHLPEFWELGIHAFEDPRFPPFAHMQDELLGIIRSPTTALILEPFKALAILALPSGVSPFAPDPQMVYFFNLGTPKDKAAVLQASVDFLHKRGYNRAIALNQSGKPDEVWAKALTPQGWTARHKASLYEFEGP